MKCYLSDNKFSKLLLQNMCFFQMLSTYQNDHVLNKRFENTQNIIVFNHCVIKTNSKVTCNTLKIEILCHIHKNKASIKEEVAIKRGMNFEIFIMCCHGWYQMTSSKDQKFLGDWTWAQTQGIFLIMAGDPGRPILIVEIPYPTGQGIPDLIDGERELCTCLCSPVPGCSNRKSNPDMSYQPCEMGEGCLQKLHRLICMYQRERLKLVNINKPQK